MSYDAQIVQIKEKLASASGVLIAVSTQLNEDKLGAALALYLALKEAGKPVSIVTAGTPKVTHSNLFGIGDIKDRLPQGKGGNLTLTLEGVVDADGKVPSLERLDWFPNGADLNLVFHVVPGQKFEPINVKTSYDQASFDLIFVFGSRFLDDLGAIYKQNTQSFSNATIINIDVSTSNTLFGSINVVDQGGTSMSEIIFQILNGVGLPINADISSNILAGIYKVTENLTKNVQANTFLGVGQAMQAGGKLPQAVQGNPKSGTFDPKPFMGQPQQANPRISEPADQNKSNQPIQQQSNQRDVVVPTPQITPQIEESTEPQPIKEDFQHPLDVNPPVEEQNNQNFQAADEKPTGEVVSSGNPESPAPDWLTPKIFKGGNLG